MSTPFSIPPFTTTLHRFHYSTVVRIEIHFAGFESYKALSTTAAAIADAENFYSHARKIQNALNIPSNVLLPPLGCYFIR